MPPRSTLVTLPPSIHGARDYGELARLGLNPDAVIDFSANSNPYGPHPAVLQAVKTAISAPTLARYPDRDCLALRRAIATVEDVPLDQVLPTNGASELIQLIALAFVGTGSRHLILAPTFGEYARAIHLMGGVIHEHRPDEPNLRFEVEAIARTIRHLQPDGIWLCTPNNPTGQLWTPAQLARLHNVTPGSHTLWVIDESYRYFSATSTQQPVLSEIEGSAVSGQRSAFTNQSLAVSEKNIIIIRSLTKDHGLAGLRLGYAIARPEHIEILRAVQPPWSVNSLAQVAGVAALQPDVLTWRKQSLAQLHRYAVDLWDSLSQMGFRVLPTSTTYALVEVDHAATLRRSLLAHGLLVRDCTSFGLPAHIRIAARLPDENKRLLAALQMTLDDRRQTTDD